jgi:hypothetical protein
MKQNFYEEYYQELKTAFESGNPSVRYNSDRAHNAVIMCFMFDHSKVVNMYCGQMSVLRKGFFDKINAHNELNDSYLGDELMEHLKTSLDGFLGREGAHLNILFESYFSDYQNDLILIEKMRKASNEKKLSMKVLPEDLKIRKSLDHFTISDTEIYRFEDDKEQHSALCSFNDTLSTSKLQQNFQVLFNLEGNTIVHLN